MAANASGWGTMPRRTARRIAREGIRRRLQPGDRLAAEQVLIAYFEVSRTTMRNALALLGFLGIVEGRAGKKGGTRIAAPTNDPVVSALGAVLQAAGADVGTVLDALGALVPTLAGAAADRAELSTVESLRQAAAAADPALGDVAFAAPVGAFVNTLAEATGNAALVSVTDALVRITTLAPLSYRRRRRAVREHIDAVVDAVERADATAARLRAQTWWDEQVAGWRRTQAADVARAVQWPDVDELLDAPRQHRPVL